jgi:hypothetical protein
MLLIHPPLTKPCEAPAALAYLSSALQHHGLSCTVCDMNIEGIHAVLQTTPDADDTWSRRAFKNIGLNLQAIRNRETYRSRDRYAQVVNELNRVLEIGGNREGIRLSLSNYQDSSLSPLKSCDLLAAADDFEKNIFYSYFSRRFDQLFSTGNHGCVGLSINYLSQALCAFAMIGFLRHIRPACRIIVGGGLITTWLSHPHWENRFTHLIDHLVGGRGETALLSLAGLETRREHYRPSFYSPALHDYLSPGFVLPYTTSSGCFWKKCSFCPENTEDNPYRSVPGEAVISDLETLVEKHNPALLHLLDNAISPAMLRKLATTSFLPPWYGFARIDRLLAQKDFCKMLKQSGCVMLKLGLESGSQRVLDRMNKGTDLATAAKVMENLKEAGIKTYVYLLFGTPEESIHEAEQTLRFVEQHSANISFLNLAVFNMPICSENRHSLETGAFYDGDLSLYTDFVHPAGWNRKEIRHFLRDEFRSSASIASILNRDPPFFTSNHAPFADW